nr:hypothetical protein [Verrucomicrobium spinosum]
MAPDPKACGVIVAGQNPLAVDTVCAGLMGFDWQKVRMLTGAFAVNRKPVSGFKFDDITVRSNDPRWSRALSRFETADTYHFKPHFGWVNHVERKS